MHEFWYDYVKPKYGEKANLHYMDTNSFIVYIKTYEISKEIADVETRSDTSNYELNRPPLKRKNKKVIGVMKDELSGKVIKIFFGLGVKTYSYLVDEDSEDKKQRNQKMFSKKEKLNLKILKTV